MQSMVLGERFFFVLQANPAIDPQKAFEAGFLAAQQQANASLAGYQAATAQVCFLTCLVIYALVETGLSPLFCPVFCSSFWYVTLCVSQLEMCRLKVFLLAESDPRSESFWNLLFLPFLPLTHRLSTSWCTRLLPSSISWNTPFWKKCCAQVCLLVAARSCGNGECLPKRQYHQ